MLIASRAVSAAILLLLALVPLFAYAADQPYYVRLFARILIFSLAALSLTLTLSYGGMISFRSCSVPRNWCVFRGVVYLLFGQQRLGSSCGSACLCGVCRRF